MSSDPAPAGRSLGRLAFGPQLKETLNTARSRADSLDRPGRHAGSSIGNLPRTNLIVLPRLSGLV